MAAPIMPAKPSVLQCPGDRHGRNASNVNRRPSGRGPSRNNGQLRRVISNVRVAISSSSFVGMTKAATADPCALISGCSLAVRRFVERQAKPGAAAGDFGACRRVVLANPACENESVEPAKRRRERADLAYDPVDEQVDCLFRRGVGDARNVRMSEEIPETPRRPDRR